MKNETVKCYGISSYDSNAMKSSNPHSGIYEAKTSRTLDLNGGNPACNQGGGLNPSKAVRQCYRHIYTDKPDHRSCNGCGGGNIPIVLAVFEGNGSRPSHKGPGICMDAEKMYTLNTTEVHGVIRECKSSKTTMHGQ